MTVFIYSTLTADQRYVEWVKGGGDIAVEGRSVLVKGGSNVANKHLLTPLGVQTEVSDEDYAFLQEEPTFRLHVQNGFITVRQKKADAEAVAADMATRDGSAPLTDADLEAQAKEAEAAGQASVKATTNRKG